MLERVNALSLRAHTRSAAQPEAYAEAKDLIMTRIASGVYRTGTKIPSCRQLASELGINRNAVAQAIKELERERVVAVVPRKGTVVIDDTLSKNPFIVASFSREVEGILKQARALGLTEAEVQRIFKECLYATYRGSRTNIVFFECNTFDAVSIARLLRLFLGRPVEARVLGSVDVSGNADWPNVDVAVTTLYHLSEVEAIFRARPTEVVGIHHAISSSALRQMARIPPDAKIGIVASNQRTINSYRNTIEAFHPVRSIVTCTLEDLGKTTELLAECDVIVDNRLAHPAVMRAIRPDVRVITVTYEIEQKSLQELWTVVQRIADGRASMTGAHPS